MSIYDCSIIDLVKAMIEHVVMDFYVVFSIVGNDLKIIEKEANSVDSIQNVVKILDDFQVEVAIFIVKNDYQKTRVCKG